MEVFEYLKDKIPPAFFYIFLAIASLWVIFISIFKGLDSLKSSGSFKQLVEFWKQNKSTVKYGVYGMLIGLVSAAFLVTRNSVWLFALIILCFAVCLSLIVELTTAIIRIFEKHLTTTEKHIVLTEHLAKKVNSLDDPS